MSLLEHTGSLDANHIATLGTGDGGDDIRFGALDGEGHDDGGKGAGEDDGGGEMHGENIKRGGW